MPRVRRQLLVLGFVATLVVVGEAQTTLGAGSSRDRTPPTQPTNFQVTAYTQTTIATSWGPSTDNVGVTGYVLYANGSRITTVSSTTLAYTFSGLACGTSYGLAVAARDKAGNLSTQATLTQGTSACSSGAPVNTGLPAISGTAQQGQTMTTTNGTWANNPDAYSYQWRRCDSAGSNCVPIAGAASSSYSVASGDVGSTIRSQVTASNPYGQSSAQSLQTAVVQSGGSGAGAYDQAVLADNPVAYWAMNSAGGSEVDLSGRGHTGTYKGGAAPLTTMMNGDKAVDFNGNGEYMTVPSSADFSISTTQQLTWEAWIRPDILQWTSQSDPGASGYVNWLGKCQEYSPTCEWGARMYASVNPDNRCNRLSAYAFNPGAGLGSGAAWQPQCNLLAAGQWLHVVGEYQTRATPAGCNNSYPGTISIWVNGVEWNMSYHMPTGCMSQYSIRPQAASSVLDVGTMALDTWFPGAIGKVAIYDYLLSQGQITAHFEAMTGAAPEGSCADTCTIPVPTQ